MSEATITIDLPHWNRQIDAIAQRAGVTLKEAAHYVHRLWNQDIIKRSPPKTYAQGRKRVAKDIGKIIVPFKPSYQWWELDPRTSGAVDVDAVVIKLKSGAVYGVDKNLFRPNASANELRAHHQKYRRRDGRVTEAGGRSDSGRNTKNIGRWKFVDSLHVPERVFRSYVRSVQKHVGKLKAGFAAGARKFGVRIPQWVLRNEEQLGSATDAMDDSGFGYLETVNRVPYAVRKIGRIVEFTARVRQKHFDKHLEKSLDRIAQEYTRMS